MRILAHSEYNLGDHVDFTYGSPKIKTDTGVIRTVHFAKSACYRPEVTWITYTVEPDDMIGFEHDDNHTIHETGILGRIT